MVYRLMVGTVDKAIATESQIDRVEERATLLVRDFLSRVATTVSVSCDYGQNADHMVEILTLNLLSAA
jgi:hypothetical protein